jgi:hypothetical protein
MRPRNPRPAPSTKPPPRETPRAADANTPPRATLRLLGDDEQLLVLDRPVLHIGRARERCGLVFTDPELAPQHCCLRLHQGRWWLVDRGAPAGPWLNNRRCREPRELHDGDRISIGLRLLEFRCTPADPILPQLPALDFELHPPPQPPPARPTPPTGLPRVAILAALVALAVTLPVAANLAPTRPVPADISNHSDPEPVPPDISHHSDPEPVPPDISHHSAPAPEFVSEPLTLELPGDALARGRPDAGHLEHALRLPPSPDYLIRCPAHAHASSTTAHELMQALSGFRNHTGYRGELVVGDLSQAGGGHYGPHRSHQSGRDVDLWLPISGGQYRRGCVRCGTDLCRPDASEVDWRATWQLVQALAARGTTQDIFLAWELQPKLRQAAQALGVPEPELEQSIQHPVHGRATLVKHAAGHTHHLHVRFRCPPGDPACISTP